jgi:MoxR-like ATPase
MIENIKKEIKKVVVGQEKMIDSLLIGLLCDGHILLESVPGLAKTTTINTVSKALNLKSKRVQFTPDLLPNDIVGTEIYDIKSGNFEIKKGPIFANLILADEINRAPAKVQSALLEAMQERQITIADETYKLPSPFLVMATQNPVDQEGVYALPEAQLDRFMLKVVIGYNSKEEELEVIRRVASKGFEEVESIIDIESLNKMKEEVKRIFVDEKIEEYIINLVDASRTMFKDYIEFGVSPRGGIDLYKASKAVAYINKRDFVSPSDIASIIKDVFRHRIILSYQAEAEEIKVDDIIEKIVAKVDIP